MSVSLGMGSRHVARTSAKSHLYAVPDMTPSSSVRRSLRAWERAEMSTATSSSSSSTQAAPVLLSAGESSRSDSGSTVSTAAPAPCNGSGEA